MQVKNLMIKEVVTVTPETNIINLIDYFLKREIDSIVVVNQEMEPIQILTLKDFLKIYTISPFPNNVAEVLEALKKDKKSLITISKQADLFHAFTLINRYKINHLPVIDSNHKLVGLFSLKRLIETIPKLIFIDPLTGLNNRYYLELIIPKLEKTKSPVGLLMIDIDDFKQINDTYGHLVGDKVLKAFSQTLRKNVRISDEVIRMNDIIRLGGEEFLAILYRCDIEKTKLVAERLRKRIEEIRFDEYPDLKVTVSIGGCEYRGEGDVMEYINLADKALCKAKKLGKNRVEVL
jgi:diguanylate cyclase (GGDEF)-like protein